MLNRIAAATAALGVLVSGPALAADAVKAEVSAVKGAVLVSQNGKLAPASQKSALRAGDRLVAKDGQATVRYADGCVVTLKAGAMATVSEASPCAGGAGLVTAGGSSAQSEGGLSDFGLAAIGWTILGIGAIVLAEDDDDTVTPVSP